MSYSVSVQKDGVWVRLEGVKPPAYQMHNVLFNIPKIHASPIVIEKVS